MVNKKPDQLVQSLDRALNIIEKLAEADGPLGVTELSNSLGLHKSTVYRLLATLSYRGYVEKDEKNNHYKIGLKLFEIGSIIINKLDLRNQIKPYLEELCELTNETIHLGILDDTEVIYIDKVEGSETIRMYSEIGKRVPTYCTSLGKVLLAYSSNKLLEQVIAGGLKAYTENTITDPEDLKRHLITVRKQGYAVDNEEMDPGIRCIAGPIFNYEGEIVAAFSISGPAIRMTEKRVDNLKEQVRAYARKMSSALGNKA